VAVAADNAVIGTASGQLHVIQFEQTPPILRQGASVRGAESLALSADASRLAVVTQAGGLLVGTPAELQPLDVAFRVHGAAWIGNTQLALRGLGDAVWVVDAGSGDVVRKLRGQQGVVQAISASDSGQWIACGTVDGEVRVWQVNPGTSVADAKPFVLARAGALGVDQVVIDEEAGDVICLLEDRSLRRFALPAGDLDVPVVQLWKQVERAFGPGSDDDRMVLNTRNSAHGVQ
jgi:hypothetical protein